MPSYTQTARKNGGVRYAARPLRPTLIMSNTARTAVSALPAGKPPSVCGKSAVKLRSRGEKCLVPCGFTGTENARQGKDTYSRKNSVLLRNKIAGTVPIRKRGAVPFIGCRAPFFFCLQIAVKIYSFLSSSFSTSTTPSIMPVTTSFNCAAFLDVIIGRPVSASMDFRVSPA